MIALLTVLHLLVCFFLILVVLLQTGKGADLAGAFGGGGSQTAFGARGAATLLSKLTTGSAIIFMITSFTLALLANRHTGSVVTDENPPAQSSQAPAPVPPLPAGTPDGSSTPEATAPDVDQPAEPGQPAGQEEPDAPAEDAGNGPAQEDPNRP